jgi:hypothetical protein
MAKETSYCQLGLPTTILGLEPRASALGGLRATIAPNGHEEKTLGVWYITIDFQQSVTWNVFIHCLTVSQSSPRIRALVAVSL